MIRNKMAGTVLAAVLAASLMISGCGKDIDPSATVATVGETKISAGLANFWLRLQQANYDSIYRQYYGKDMWTSDTDGSGNTMGDTVKQGVMDGFKQLYVLDAHKADYNIELTDDEMAKIKSVAKSFMEKNSSTVTKGFAVTREEDVAEALRLLTVESKVSAAIKSGVDKNVSDEEAAQRTFIFARFGIKTKTNETGAAVDMTEEEISATRADAAKVLEDIKAGGDFRKTAEDKKATVIEYSYGKDDDGLAKEVLAAADKLKEGEISDIIEADGFLFILRLEKEFNAEATADKKQSIIIQRENELFESVTKPWLDATTLSVDEKEWAKFGFDRTMTMAAPSSSAAQ